MLIALAQTNSTVGDLCGNARSILDYARRANDAGAGVVVFPELALTGYPPRDLLEKQSFLDRTEEHLEQLAADSAGLNTAIICGTVTTTAVATGKHIFNSAAVLERGRVAFRQNKMLLPTYDVFDETRYFQPADKQFPIEIRGAKTALTICEDVWNDKQYWERRLYSRDPVEELATTGAGLLISINASPYNMDKRALRREMLRNTARHFHVPLVYVNQAGGNDQLVFDGSSFAMDASGNVVASAASFAVDLVMFDSVNMTGDRHENLANECEAVYEALVMGTRDYIRKCGFQRVLIGLSGGIDSSLVAAIAVDAVGRENVTGIGMPGPYSSEHSVRDARELAANLGIGFEVVPIGGVYDSFLNVLDPVFGDRPRDVTEENVQSRLRGVTETRANWRLATARSTAICAAAWPSSATCPRRWSTSCPEWRIAGTMGPFQRVSSRNHPPRSCGPIRKIRIRCRRMKCWTRFCGRTWNTTSLRSKSRTRSRYLSSLFATSLIRLIATNTNASRPHQA
jgi:NAD+ synthase (glutamine-hydrolysing)